MSKTLRLQAGDLVLTGGGYDTLSGPAKVQQDLGIAFLTRKGSNPMHLDFGSSIDGGTLPTGERIQSIIGETDPSIVRSRVEREIRSIVADYKAAQAARIQNDRYRYGKSSIPNDEIVLGVNSINFVQNQDTLFVRVSVTTQGNQDVTIGFAVG